MTDQDRLQAEACKRMLRRQMVDIVRSNGVGDLFDWRDQDIAEICREEMAKRGDEEVQAFDADNLEALASGEVCGFTGEDLLPGAQDFGASAAETATRSHRSDAVLQEHLERQRGVRKGTFGAFCANYRLARTQPDPAATEAAAMMLELLPHVHQLGYLKWWVCRDAWAEALVAAGA
jgi:beta-phosphoglucomutase-like phosphatase (HAD superfamily)